MPSRITPWSQAQVVTRNGMAASIRKIDVNMAEIGFQTADVPTE